MSDILTGDAGARDWQTLTDGLRPLGYRQLSQTYIIDGGLHHCPQGNGTPTRALKTPCRHWTALSLPDMLTTTRRDLHPAFWVSMTGTDNFIQKTDPRKPLGYHITYKFTANVFSYPLPSPHKMYANLNVLYVNVLFRCTSRYTQFVNSLNELTNLKSDEKFMTRN